MKAARTAVAVPLRRLREDEWRELWEIDQRCFAREKAYPQSEFRRLLKTRPSFHAGAENERGRLVGFVLSAPEHGRGHIITLDVLPGYRRHGVGSALMLAAEAHYRTEPGIAGMRLEAAVTNRRALRFYAGLEYHPAGWLPGYYARNLDGLSIEKDFFGTA